MDNSSDIPKPISCDLYDHLEIWSMRQQVITITYKEDDRTSDYTGKIKNLVTKDKIEYLITDKDIVIPLHHIVKIEDLVFDSSCAF
jgi:transcriptional antiterminator Rof (Rho-off)